MDSLMKIAEMADRLPELFERLQRMEMKMDEQLIDLATASEITGLSPQTIIKRIKNGTINGTKKYGVWRMPKSELLKVEDAKEQKPAEKKVSKEKADTKQYILYG